MRRVLSSYLFAIATVCGAVAVLLQVSSYINTGTAASMLLLSVLIVAHFRGLRPAVLAAAVSTAAYNYFFLPPRGFGIDDLNDWVAFGAFTATALIAGRLWGIAQHRQRKIEQLYSELQASFDRAAEAEAERRSERLRAALLDALT